MDERIVDCRGLACPAPVLKVKELIDKEQPEYIIVTVDNAAAKENVGRFLARSGYSVEISLQGEEFVLKGIQGEKQTHCEEECTTCESSPDTERLLILIGTNKLGSGSEELGSKLMINFISTLMEMVPHLWRIVFLNSGVYLATKNSPVIKHLKELEEKGVSILVCGTCLDFYGLMEQKEIGETTNMLDIITSMDVADKVISIT